MQYLIFVIIVIAFVLIVFIEGMIRERKSKLKYREWLKTSWGKKNELPLGADEMSNICRYSKRVAERYKSEFYVDDITWKDLSFDDIFSDMDTCSCILGEEMLYHRLRCPELDNIDEDYSHFVKLREYFEEHEDERIAVQEILHDIGINRKTSIVTVFEYVDSLKAESNIQHYIMIFLMLLAIGLVFVLPGAGVIMLIAAMVISIGTYLKKKKAIEPVIVTFNYTAKMLKAADRLKKLSPKVLSVDIERMNDCREPLKSVLRKSIWLTTGSASMDNPAMLLEEYVKMFFHIDLIMINLLIRLLKERTEEIGTLRRILGTIDASIAAGSYKAGLERVCIPEFGDGERCYNIKNCIHPLIKEAVPNSIETNGPVLLTGSNASGKSTFLKTVAISAIFAQSLGYVPAEEYRAPRFAIYTSMALSDSILNGESYFIVEIKSLKRILDAKDNGYPVLCCIDEVLRGTNTIERIAASTQILKCFSDKCYIPFAATHDIELTKLLDDDYTNYHFDEEITGDDDVCFNYRMKKGPAVSRNAIKLLKVLNYDDRLIKDAEAMVDKFTETHKWD
ncbi:MAG: hypothetical protein IKT17_05705 [Lachnospiraceae bacterium]|nr:hypothetical protein [Lachnospiraceae bacterium]